METHPAAAGSGGGGKNNPPRNRKSKSKRSRRKGDNSRRNAGGNAGSTKGGSNKRSKGPPSPPQTKIVIRNIEDATKFASVENVIGLVRSFLDGANQKLAALNSRCIQLDESSVACLIEEAEAVRKAEEEEKAKKSEENDAKETSTDDIQNISSEPNGESVEANASVTEKATEKNGTGLPKNGEKSDVSLQDAPSVALSLAENSTTNLGARIVYITPPKQTRRRGVKPGCAYLVISGPRIDAKEPPTTTTMTDSSHSNPSKDEKKDLIESKDTTGNANGQPAENAAQDSSVAGGDTHEDGENHVVIMDPPSEKDSNAAAAITPSADYSREVAQGRFLVFQAIDVMEEHAKDDAKSEQRYAGSVVEVAMSGKTYKHHFHRRDRREGTVEQTADYRNFMEKTAKDKEERMSRPKPAPGGGVSSAVTATSETVESGQPIAALVEHIRNKRSEASKRKKAKKKAKDSANKEKGANASSKAARKKKGKEGTNEEGGKKGGRKKEGKKSKRSGKKKNSKAGNNNTTTATPTALLKPGAATPGAVATAQQPAASLPAANGVTGGFQGYG